MSNNVVGNVYQQVIDDVINASRVDFEEGGVDEAVLEELKKGWQQKLSQLDVAAFPWDPKQEPVPTPVAAPIPVETQQQQLPLPGSFSQAGLSPQNTVAGGPAQAGPAVSNDQQNPVVNNEPIVKQEPGTAGDIAQMRAMQNISARFGDKANAINPQTGAGQRPAQAQQQQPRSGTNSAVPGPATAGQQTTLQQQQQTKPDNSQMDGTADDTASMMEGVLMRRDAAGNMNELGRVDIDRMMHAQIFSNAKAMEGGGLMLPLKEATKHRARSTGQDKKACGGPAAYDGGDDEDDEDAKPVIDEDAINSDLDDPDEEKDDDEVDDEGLGHIMLCMYDKVQRVKNKWKCVLKDGVLTVNGKEYVFHKATGEYEW